MLDFYERTHLEEWVESLYQHNNIWSPQDLTIENLSAVLGIGVTFAPGIADEAIFDEEYAHIFINSHYPPQRRWEVFCHELCHPLRHMGNQLSLPDAFRKLQEMDAHAFQAYAAIPFYMVQNIQLPDDEAEIIELLVGEFGVTAGFAQRRWEQIQRRIARGRWEQNRTQALTRQNKKAAPQLLREQLVSYLREYPGFPLQRLVAREECLLT